ncbi:MAG: hypothetical protein ACLFTX_07090, partial [Thiohalospira sp.]
DSTEDDSTEEDTTEEDTTEEDTTPWYEDEDLTQVGITGFLGVSQELPATGPGFAEDGEEPPDPDFDGVFVAEVDGEGLLREMVYFDEVDGEYNEIRMVADDGAEPADSGSADGLGIHWGRWNLGDFTKEVDDEPVISGEEDAVPGTDWHWLVLEDADDLMTGDQFTELVSEGKKVDFQWAGGPDVRGAYLDPETEETSLATFSVERFDLTADFGEESFTEGELALEAKDGDPPRGEIVLDAVDPDNQSMGADSFYLSINSDDGSAGGQVEGYFIGEEADGAGVTFSVYTEEDIQGLEGVGALEKQ